MLVRRNELSPTISNIFGDFFDKELTNWSRDNFSASNTTLPAVNIQEYEEKFIVEMAVPGMNKKDFNIDLKDDLLSISASKEHEVENEDNYTRKEYCYQSFTRTFALPKVIVDSDKISAKYVNGELIITIPKKEEAKPKAPQTIKIS